VEVEFIMQNLIDYIQHNETPATSTKFNEPTSSCDASTPAEVTIRQINN
jgi:hypothetical protein